MTRVSSAESVLAPFDGRVLSDRYRYRLERRGDDFIVITDDPQFGSEASAHRVVLVTGSHHQQQYWFETGRGRTIARLPFFWRIPDARFVPSHAALLAQATNEVSEAGTWNRTCIRCHSTHSLPRFGDLESYDTQVAELGIACESCHGPGEEHARANRDPIRRYQRHFDGEADDTIVNPTRLAAQRSIDVCGRCHSVHAFRSLDDVAAWSERGIPFQPGEDLAQAFHVFEVGQGEEHSAVAFMNDLHLGRDSGAGWKVAIDITALLMALVSLTGLVLIFTMRKGRIRRLTAAGAGLLFFALIYAMYVP